MQKKKIVFSPWKRSSFFQTLLSAVQRGKVALCRKKSHAFNFFFSLNVYICSRWESEWKFLASRKIWWTQKICKMQTGSRTKRKFCTHLKSTEEFQITNVIRTTSCSDLCLCLWSCNHLMEKYMDSIWIYDRLSPAYDGDFLSSP